MKAPSKTKKYMILFSVLLFIVVLSIVIAFYVGTKKSVGEIPQKVGEEFKVLPVVQKMEGSLDNLTDGQGNLDKGKKFTVDQFARYLHMYMYYLCTL